MYSFVAREKEIVVAASSNCGLGGGRFKSKGAILLGRSQPCIKLHNSKTFLYLLLGEASMLLIITFKAECNIHLPSLAAIQVLPDTVMQVACTAGLVYENSLEAPRSEATSH